MPAIQIDMFEVQLGAAILLQFEEEGRTVRVLADAGIKASGYDVDHVHKKVKPMIGEKGRIDLIIGTHYDEDHLNGLVPIITDKDINIGEAWMPPVVNDTTPAAADEKVRKGDLLPLQFRGEGGNSVLQRYRAAKRAEIEMLLEIQAVLAPEVMTQAQVTFADRPRVEIIEAVDVVDVARDADDLDDLRFFRAQLEEVSSHVEDIHHADVLDGEGDPFAEQLIADVMLSRNIWWPRRWHSLEHLKMIAGDQRTEAPETAAAQARSIRKSVKVKARDAINATALHKVVQALDARRIPIQSEIIDDGAPRRYRWDVVSKKFVLAPIASSGLGFVLLGPSRALVKKHRDKLPIMETAMVALSFRGELARITESNQLSYIGCFEHRGQRILISGDAGCVDFKPDKGKTYYQPLLDALTPLHVVQVAHHGGANAHFYRVLDAAKYPEQESPSFLLFSHKTHDEHRPSTVFRDFYLEELSEREDVRLLFTGEPTKERAEKLLKAIHPPVGPKHDRGDIQLRFDVSSGWTVTAHAIEVAHA